MNEIRPHLANTSSTWVESQDNVFNQSFGNLISKFRSMRTYLKIMPINQWKYYLFDANTFLVRYHRLNRYINAENMLTLLNKQMELTLSTKKVLYLFKQFLLNSIIWVFEWIEYLIISLKKLNFISIYFLFSGKGHYVTMMERNVERAWTLQSSSYLIILS